MSGSWRRGPEPTGKWAIRTSDPLVRKLFMIAHQRKISMTEIAKGINMTKVGLSRWKHGVSNPSMLSIQEFANFLGYRIELVPGDD